VEGDLTIEDLGAFTEAKEDEEIDNLLEPELESGILVFWW